MIVRIWHGWTAPRNADAYQELLDTEVVPGILDRGVAGLVDVSVLRRDLGDEVEFITIMRFDDLAAVRAFAGDDYEHSVVPPAAQALLSRWDQRSQHYERVGLHTVRDEA